jgi:hypothetical protein
MSDIDPFHADLIRRLGGKTWLAGALGIPRNSITRWHERGIPSRYWHRVVDLAAAARPPIAVTEYDLEARRPTAMSVENA